MRASPALMRKQALESYPIPSWMAQARAQMPHYSPSTGRQEPSGAVCFERFVHLRTMHSMSCDLRYGLHAVTLSQPTSLGGRGLPHRRSVRGPSRGQRSDRPPPRPSFAQPRGTSAPPHMPWPAGPPHMPGGPLLRPPPGLAPPAGMVRSVLAILESVWSGPCQQLMMVSCWQEETAKCLCKELSFLSAGHRMEGCGHSTIFRCSCPVRAPPWGPRPPPWGPAGHAAAFPAPIQAAPA